MVETEQETEVVQAVRTAKEYLNTVYADEVIRDIGLEEVVFDEELKKWKITLGFFRAWDPVASMFGSDEKKNRSYKVISINDRNGEAESIIDRILPNIKK